jgi:ABC-type multidrug transport system fused ATPase/permease subunit
MVQTLQKVLESMLDRLYNYVTIYLPSLLAAVILFLGAYLAAVVARWLLYRIFKGPAIDKFLRQSGLAFMLDPSGRLRAKRLVAETVFWCFLLCGFLLGLSVFDTDITTKITQNLIFLMPKLVVAGVILLGGAWLGHYLGRSMLVWAVNESIPGARRLAVVVRVVVMFVAVVVAADQLDFARSVFLAAFIILVGGAVLTASLAIGLSGGILRRLLEPQKEPQVQESSERSLWNHL